MSRYMKLKEIGKKTGIVLASTYGSLSIFGLGMNIVSSGTMALYQAERENISLKPWEKWTVIRRGLYKDSSAIVLHSLLFPVWFFACAFI